MRLSESPLKFVPLRRLDQMGQALQTPRYPDLYAHLSEQVMKLTGVQLGEKQRSMVESRLHKRIHELGFRSITEYQSYYESHEKEEIQSIVGLLTTHYTYFFREFAHFEYIAEKVLPELVPLVRQRPDKTLLVWSAAVSRGQEAYSLAMFLNHHLKAYGGDIRIKILGTDVDEQSVKIASNGVYPRKEISEAPLAYLGDHWARGTGEISDYVKARAPLRKMVEFHTANLLDFRDRVGDRKFDLIFCRNVFIYFSPEQIRSSTERMLKHLYPHGHFFIGMSESLSGLGFELKCKGPSVYRFPDKSPLPALEPKKVLPPVASVPKIIKVFCVDDSSSIHTLLKQILKPDQGFEIVGQAMNGVEAVDKLKKMDHVDVITLDIHMPEMTGIEYLERHFVPGHPPVVMVSSVSRDQSELPLRTLKLGASDYVEKPALNALQERGEELRAKLKTAVLGRNQSERSLRLEEEFKKKVVILAPERKLRVLASGLAHLKKTAQFLKDLDGSQPPVHILFEGVSGNLPEIARELSFLSGKKVVFLEDLSVKARPGEIRVLDFKKGIQFISKAHAGDRLSVAVLGEWGKQSALELKGLRAAQLLLEDLGGGKGAEHLHHIASDVFPSTSFPFLGSEFFAKGDT